MTIQIGRQMGGTGLLRFGAALLLACVAVSSCTQKGGGGAEVVAAKRPNIVFILADDLGYSDLGAFGGEIPTPNLDALAKRGMLLTSFYAAMSCAPTRAMLMSGMDNHRAGMGVQGVPRREDQRGKPGYEGHLNFRVASLAELMSDAGYNTYMTGKWHLGSTTETGPRARGFKRSFVSLDGAAHLNGWDWRGPQPANYRDGDDIVQVGDDWYTTRDYTTKMIDYIEQDRAEGKPFFAYLAYTAPHWPLQAPKEAIAKMKGRYDAGYEALYAERFARQKALGLIPKDAQPIDNARFRPRWSEVSAEDRKFEARRMEIYAAMVAELDVYVGQFIDYLKKTGQFENTFILFASDNGAEPGRLDLNAPYKDHVGKEYDHSLDNLGSETSYVMYGANWATVSASPFYRHKGSAFEGGIHVPAFVHYPGKVKAGTRSNAVGTMQDVLPTFLDVAGAKHPGTAYKGRDILLPTGKSMKPVVYGSSPVAHPETEVLGWEQGGPRAVRQGEWKIVWDQSRPAAERRWQLFNIAKDPEEQHDVSASNPEKFAALQQAWAQYATANGVIY